MKKDEDINKEKTQRNAENKRNRKTCDNRRNRKIAKEMLLTSLLRSVE